MVSGGYWAQSESPIDATFDPARSTASHSNQDWADAVRAWRAAGSNVGEHETLRINDVTAEERGEEPSVPDSIATPSEGSITRFFEGGEGDTISAAVRLKRGRFRRTQLLVTVNHSPLHDFMTSPWNWAMSVYQAQIELRLGRVSFL